MSVTSAPIGQTMVTKHLLFLVIAWIPLASTASERDLARGAEILQPFKQQLQSALREGLASGPADAIAACRTKAPEIAASISRDGIRVGRASHRLRNPKNVPPEWAAPLLDGYRDDPSSRAPRAVDLGEHRRGYVEPILVVSDVPRRESVGFDLIQTLRSLSGGSRRRLRGRRSARRVLGRVSRAGVDARSTTARSVAAMRIVIGLRAPAAR
jgi:hypothetical protein